MWKVHEFSTIQEQNYDQCSDHTVAFIDKYETTVDL